MLDTAPRGSSTTRAKANTSNSATTVFCPQSIFPTAAAHSLAARINTCLGSSFALNLQRVHAEAWARYVARKSVLNWFCRLKQSKAALYLDAGAVRVWSVSERSAAKIHSHAGVRDHTFLGFIRKVLFPGEVS